MTRETLSFRLLPGCCLLCGEKSGRDRDLCGPCEGDLPAMANACRSCATPLRGDDEKGACGNCLQKPPPQDTVIAAYRYEFPLNVLIQRFKFNSEHVVGRELGVLFAEAFRDVPAPGCLVPVPLHPHRLRERGFNQSELLCRQFVAQSDVTLRSDLLLRSRETALQSGMDARERRRNVRGAFVLADAPLPAHVTVVDDVVTTGSTAGEIASLLKRAGVRRVDVWALARTP